MRACFICKEEKRANVHDPYCGHREHEVLHAESAATNTALLAAVQRERHPALVRGGENHRRVLGLPSAENGNGGKS